MFPYDRVGKNQNSIKTTQAFSGYQFYQLFLSVYTLSVFFFLAVKSFFYTCIFDVEKFRLVARLLGRWKLLITLHQQIIENSHSRPFIFLNILVKKKSNCPKISMSQANYCVAFFLRLIKGQIRSGLIIKWEKFDPKKCGEAFENPRTYSKLKKASKPVNSLRLFWDTNLAEVINQTHLSLAQGGSRKIWKLIFMDAHSLLSAYH